MKAEKDLDKMLKKLDKTAEKLKKYKEELLKYSYEAPKAKTAAKYNAGVNTGIHKSGIEFSKSGQWRLTDYKRSKTKDPLPQGKRSMQGRMVDLGEKEKAKDLAQETLGRLRAIKKPKLTKEEINNENSKPTHDVHVRFTHQGQEYSHTFEGVKAAGGSHAVNRALDHIRNKLPGVAIGRVKAVAVK